MRQLKLLLVLLTGLCGLGCIVHLNLPSTEAAIQVLARESTIINRASQETIQKRAKTTINPKTVQIWFSSDGKKAMFECLGIIEKRSGLYVVLTIEVFRISFKLHNGTWAITSRNSSPIKSVMIYKGDKHGNPNRSPSPNSSPSGTPI